MKNRKYKLAVFAAIAVFALICFCICTGKDVEITKALISLLGAVILFYMGGNVGAAFAVNRPEKKQ